jgi:uncharacterized repeat protein (TIGR03806 family)
MPANPTRASLVAAALLVAACSSSAPEDPGPKAGMPGMPGRPANATCKPPASYSQPAARLSATGCADPADPKKPAPGLIPYTVASPLWSDGATKQRFMALPDGQTIHVKDCTREPGTCKTKAEGGTPDDEGHFVFPTGTVLVKSFALAGKLVETRLFTKLREDRWIGYGYRWNEEQTDATIVPEDGAGVDLRNEAGQPQRWVFPSRNDCLLCHNDVVGFSLGPETRQLAVPFRYPSGVTENQLDALERIGVFDAPVKRLPPLPDPAAGDDPATADARARSYMHANCAICHRPQGNFPGIDMRFEVPLGAMGVCNLEPTKGTAEAGPPETAKRLAPGHPEQSTTYTRMTTLDGTVRMPQVATGVVDPLGTRLVSDWIKRITACP